MRAVIAIRVRRCRISDKSGLCRMTSMGSKGLSDYLLPGETILWQDRPGQGIIFSPSDALLIPFSLVWGSIAFFGEWTVLRSHAPIMFVLFGTLFALAGLFLIVGRFVLDAWIRAHMTYALTDRRILIIRGRPQGSVKTINLDRLPEATLTEAANGRGTIRFGSTAFPFGGPIGTGFGPWLASLGPVPQFLAISDASRVFATIQDRMQKDR